MTNAQKDGAAQLDLAPARFLDRFEELRMDLSNAQLIHEAIEINHAAVGKGKTLERYRHHLVHFSQYLASVHGATFYTAKRKHVPPSHPPPRPDDGWWRSERPLAGSSSGAARVLFARRAAEHVSRARVGCRRAGDWTAPRSPRLSDAATSHAAAGWDRAQGTGTRAGRLPGPRLPASWTC